MEQKETSRQPKPTTSRHISRKIYIPPRATYRIRLGPSLRFGPNRSRNTPKTSFTSHIWAITYSSDWNKNRYHGAIYHQFGDPKLQIQFGGGALSAASYLTSITPPDPDPIQGPRSQVSVSVPMYTVKAQAGGDAVDIPGGKHLVVLGQPAVPFYAVNVLFPKGQIVQDVTLLKQSELLTATGLKLPPLESFVNSANHPFHPEASPASAADWWPETDFDWSVSRHPDGSSTLALKAFAFRYRAVTGEARFFTNFTFNIDYAPSPVEITRLSLDKTVDPAGAPVRADLYLRSSSQTPLAVVAEARIFENEDPLVAQLPPRLLRALQGTAWTRFEWQDPKHPSGDYALHVVLHDSQGVELDRARAEFQLGQADGRIRQFNFNPPSFQPGDKVRLSATFDNTGSTTLTGDLIFALQDATGNLVAELHQPFFRLAPGTTCTFDTQWVLTLAPRDCVVLVYAQFGGQTTALSVGAD